MKVYVTNGSAEWDSVIVGYMNPDQVSTPSGLYSFHSIRNEISITNHDLRSRLCPGIKLGMKSTFFMAKTVSIRNEILIYRDLSILN